jgi:D-alanyl-D-alanine carboxypeptidase (penicillin-binding protein 5/6)
MRWLTAVVLALACNAQARAEEPPAEFAAIATAWLLQQDGSTRWQQAAERRLPPASLTKIMTALLVLERGGLEQVATVGAAAAAETGTRAGLRAGDQLSVADLLVASLVASANDACHALADHVDGSEAAFVLRMNQRAQELGLLETHFSNACGHDAADHRSSARDLATLTGQALAHAEFARLVALQAATIDIVNRGRRITLKTSNALLGRYPGALGVKTGFTPNAGKCLVALAERDGRRLLLVLLDAPDRWWSASDVFDRAFAPAADVP